MNKGLSLKATRVELTVEWSWAWENPKLFVGRLGKFIGKYEIEYNIHLENHVSRCTWIAELKE